MVHEAGPAQGRELIQARKKMQNAAHLVYLMAETHLADHSKKFNVVKNGKIFANWGKDWQTTC